MSGTVAETPAGAGQEEGLRARKRAATSATIERVALNLAAERGYDNVTVDMICEASMVSPRTFFNYFGSKEGVILGTAGAEPSEEERETFLSSTSADVLTELVAMLTAAISENDRDPSTFALRRQIITQHPELLGKQVDRMSERESKLVDLVMERFGRQGRSAAQTPDLENEARMVVALVGSVLRFTAREWFEAGSAASTAELLHGAVRLIRRITHAEAAPE